MGKRKSGTFRRGEDVRGFPEGTPFFAEGFLEGPVKLVRDLQDKRLLVIVETMFASSHADYLDETPSEKRVMPSHTTRESGLRPPSRGCIDHTTAGQNSSAQKTGCLTSTTTSCWLDKKWDSGLTVALVERSETEKLAWDALQQGIQWRRQNQEPVTGALLEWALDVAEGTRERPRSGREQTTTVRNALIAKTVKTLVACGMPKARNEESSTKESAYDVVAEGFKNGISGPL